MIRRALQGDETWQQRWLRRGLTALILLVPLHAVFAVWLASQGFSYDLVRLWKEIVLLGLLLLVLGILWHQKSLARSLVNDRLVRLILAFLGLIVVYSIAELLFDVVSPKAVGFGLIIDTRMLLTFLAVFILLRSGGRIAIPTFVAIPALLVIGFGLLQMTILSPDALRHVGYNDETIPAYQAVDNNPNFPRVQSTLRGPNPLAAYLIPTLLVLVTIASSSRSHKKRLIVIILSGLVVLFGTYSRSAWIGMVLAAGFWLFWWLKPYIRRIVLLVAAGGVLIGGAGVYVLRDNDLVQNVVFHSSEKSTSSTSSNEKRARALMAGLSDVAHHPLGGGIGSAGPASPYNEQGKARVAENFYIQIGQELGWLGLGLYLAITTVMLHRLWHKRTDTFVRATLAAFIGLIAVNLLSHAWSDDTLAYVFGAMLAYALANPSDVILKRKHVSLKKTPTKRSH